jgi:hypothetical protein
MHIPAHVRDLAIVAYAFGASAAFDGPALVVALGLGTATVALTTPRRSPGETPRYRLEHRHPGGVRVLAATSDEAAARTGLQDQAAALTVAGATGQLVLVHVATRQAVTWQVLAPRPSHPSRGGTDAEGPLL